MKEEAETIFKEVRNLYIGQGSYKSSNKKYNMNVVNKIDFELKNKHGQIITKEAFVNKANYRNDQQKLAEKWDEEIKPKRNDGMRLIEDENFTLNCLQLTRECQKKARAKYPLQSKSNEDCVWHVHLEKSDHCFCVLGKGFGQWRTSFQSYGAPPYSTILKGQFFVIDPWLNVTCDITDYASEASGKFKRWNKLGKQIYPHGVLSSPDEDFCRNFLAELPLVVPAPG